MGLFLWGFVAFGLARCCIAANAPDAGKHNGPSGVAEAVRKFRTHPHSEMQASPFASVIEQVRFNQRPILFEGGVRAGPGGGDLEIQFAAGALGPLHRLRYRLLGADAEWREAGTESEILRYHLAPGHYEFDFVQAENSRKRGAAIESIPITVIAPYWQTAWFRSLCAVFLLLLILLLHRLRVRYLKGNNQKLQETVSRTKAELTLTAKIAGDAQEALKEQALKDGLTGLWNRRAVFAMLEREIHRAQRDGFAVTVVMIDLDHFKNINDTYGHPTGDEVLREAAGRLIEVMRPYDFIGRYGGEEFLVVLPSCSSQNGMRRGEEFRRAIAARPVFTAAGQLAVTCSVGVAAYDQAMPPDDLIHRADAALYRAKRLGRNCVCAGEKGAVVERGFGPRKDQPGGERARTGELG
ncbi:MAG TPA: GGDEF domain-containing protein [Acidobacteriaceae bacterium]